MMEAVPRLPMISFPGRPFTKPVEFGDHLKRYIRDHYHEDPESYNYEIAELESLRQSAFNASTDFVGCSTLKKYYCQLHYLTSRFHFDETGIKLSFTWSSAFDHTYSESGDINYEMNSILYNIATLHTSLGAMDVRTTPDGMKISCTHFQCASWAFQVLGQNCSSDSELNSQLMNFMMNLSLAQAQECILEKSMSDNRKPNIIAKVAMQVVEYLRTTLQNLDTFKKSNTNAVELVGSKLLKLWQRHCDFKIAFYMAVTLFHQGLQSEEQQKMGERLAYYQGAVEKLDEASKLAKNLEKAKVIAETLTFANDVIRGKLTGAQKENEFVYHEKVVPLSSLTEVKGASLVKGIPFSFTDKEVAGPDIFGRLVPLEAHEASSLYSEEKAKLLRRITSEIQEKNEELEMYLASMQLDSVAFEENLDTLPQELVDACADLNSRDALAFLSNIVAEINSLYAEVQSKIKAIEDIIKDEEAKEKEFCIMMGTKKTPNHILTEQKRELGKYKETHQAALASNQALENAVKGNKENIAILSKPLNTLIESLPSVAGVESDGDKATRAEVQRLLSKVREMQTQRIDFESQIRTNLQDDDVTKQLVTNTDDMDHFFKQQLDKHKPLVSLLEQNMAAQINILQALSEANAAYGATRRMMIQVKGQRSEVISSLLSSYNGFLGIFEKTEEAKGFYTKLDSQVNKLYTRVKSFSKVQEEEREERLAANVKKLSISGPHAGQPHGEVSTGPKLRDFLQAGMTVKGMTTDMASMNMSGVHTDYKYPGMAPGSIAPSQMLASYRNTPSRPPPLGSEKTDNRTTSSSVVPSYVPSPYPPSAPSPAPAAHPTSSTGQSQPAGVPYQPQQQMPTYYNTGAASTSVPSMMSNVPSSQSCSVGYGYSGTPAAGSMTGAPTSYPAKSSNMNLNYNTQSAYTVNTYQPSVPQTSGLTSYSYASGNTNATYSSNNMVRPHLPTQAMAHVNPQSTYGQMSYPAHVPGQQHSIQPPLSTTSNATFPHPSSSNSTGIYISQAGANNTTLSSSSGTHTGGFGQSESMAKNATSKVRDSSAYYAPYQYHHTTKYLPTAYSSTAMSNNQNIPQSYTSIHDGTVGSLPHQVKVDGKPLHGQMTPGAPSTSYSQNHSQSALSSHSKSYNYPAPAASYFDSQNPNDYAPNLVHPPPKSYNRSTNPNIISNTTISTPSYLHTLLTSTDTPQHQTYTSSTASPYDTLQKTQPTVPVSQAQPMGYSNPALLASRHYQPSPQYPQQYSAAASQNSQNRASVQPPSSAPSGTPVTKASQGGISNLDLLSDIDMSASAGSQWSVLAPQNVSSDPSKQSVGKPSSVTGSDEVPDLTSSVPNSKGEPTQNGFTLTDQDTMTTDSEQHTLSSDASTATVIDLYNLAKKRSVTTLDPLTSDETLNALALETERLSKFVQGLDKKSLNGPTNLELKWNELCDNIEGKCSHLKVSVGRCYPLKNRFPDNLSFDSTRVTLPSARDDYINASYVQLKSVEESMPLIITQAPMPNTFNDFWTMIWENQVELIICLNTDAEVKGQVYIPKETTNTFESGSFTITLKQSRPAPNDAWIQRTLLLTHNANKLNRVLIHIQFLTWPPSAMPESPGLFLQLIADVHNLQKQQRNKLNPVVVHCVSGTGRSGVFAVLSSFIKYLQNSGSLADLWSLVIDLNQQRRAAIQDRTHLLFLYSAALYYAQEILMKRGILTDKATFEEGPREKTHVRHPSADLLSSDLSRMKAKLGLDEPGSNDTNLSRSESQSSVLSGTSSTGRVCMSTPPPASSVSPSPTHSAKTKLGTTELPPNLAASLDPSCLVLTTPNPEKKQKITKESFLNPAGVMEPPNADSKDPLSVLDPLWNLKKA